MIRRALAELCIVPVLLVFIILQFLASFSAVIRRSGLVMYDLLLRS